MVSKMHALTSFHSWITTASQQEQCHVGSLSSKISTEELFVGFSSAPSRPQWRKKRVITVAAATKKFPKVGAGPVPWRQNKWVREKARDDPNYEKQRRWETLASAVLNDEENAGVALDAARANGWLQRTDIVGLLVRLKQLQRWRAALEVSQ